MRDQAPFKQMVNIFFKDVRVAKRYLLIIIPFYLLYGAVFYNMTPVYILVNMIYTFFLTIGVTIIDDYFQAHGLLCSLPMKRSTVVLGRYFSSFLVLFAGIAVCYLYALLLKMMIGSDYDVAPVLILRGILPYGAVIVLFFSLFYPFYFRLGILKGFIVFSFSLLGVAAVGAIIGRLMRIVGKPERALSESGIWKSPGMALLKGFDSLQTSLGTPLLYGFVLVCLAGIAWISVTLSVRFYKRRDF